MLKITDNYQEDQAGFKQVGIELPKKVEWSQKTNWLHFGGGNLFRAFHMDIQQRLLNQGLTTSPLVLVETFDEELINKVYLPNKNRTLKVELTADGQNRLSLLDSLKEAIYLNGETGYEATKKYFTSETLQLVSFTITEKGYNLKDQHGDYLPFIEAEINGDPKDAITTIGLLVSLLNERFEAGAQPLSLVSTDNFSHNGDKLKESVLTITKEWLAQGFFSQDFLAYLEDGTKVAFPWSMIDRITPNPAPLVKSQLEKLGLKGMEIIKTAKGSTSAAFGNTEETHYLVIEDDFPNGRPPLEAAGVIVTTREIVDKIERMKVCTCLNPLHTALAVFGCLLGYEYIYDEMKDNDLNQLVQQIGYVEGLPVVVDPVVIKPENFIEEVLTKRFPNPYIPDTPQRIATDTSQKLAIRFGNTIEAYHNTADLQVSELVFISLTIAAWLRYLLAVDDQERPFEPSPDPLLVDLRQQLKGNQLGKEAELKALDGLLENELIFGINLFEVGIAPQIKQFFQEMLVKGGVRQTLQQTVQQYQHRLSSSVK